MSAPDFLLTKLGDIVVIEEESSTIVGEKADWWVGYVIHAVGGARDPCANSLFQVVCVDTGFVRTINADAVKGILRRNDISL